MENAIETKEPDANHRCSQIFVYLRKFYKNIMSMTTRGKIHPLINCVFPVSSQCGTVDESAIRLAPFDSSFPCHLFCHILSLCMFSIGL